MKSYSYLLCFLLFFAEQLHSQSGKIKLVVPAGHSRGVHGGAFSRNSQFVATFGSDGVNVWDVLSGKLFHRLQQHPVQIMQVNFNPANTQIITVSTDNVIRLSDVATGKLIKTLDEENDNFFIADFTKDGKRIVSVCENGTIKIWNAQTLEILHEIREERRLSLSTFPYLSHDGEYLVTGLRNGPVRIWNTITGTKLRELNTEGRDIGFMFFSWDDQYLI